MNNSNQIFDLTLVITHECNLNCIYCYEILKDKSVMSLDTAKVVLSKYLNNTKYKEIAINLFGGEPFLRFPFIKEICEWTWNKEWPVKYLFYADTNGVSLSDEIKNWTSKNKERFKMLLSLDGTPRTHNHNRSNSFEKIDLDYFVRNWADQGVKMTIHEDNIGTIADDIIFIHEKGIKVKGCNFAEGLVIHDFDKKIGSIQEQFEKLAQWYIDNPDTKVSQLFDLKLHLCESHKNQPIKYCGCGSDALRVIDVDGSEYPCTYFFPLSMRKNELETVRAIDLSDEHLFINDECVNNCYISPVCSGCYGDNYTATGCFHTKSKQKCRIAKLRAIYAAKIQGERMLQQTMPKTITEQQRDTIIAINKILALFNGEADSQ